MQTAEALLEIIHERGRKGLRLERLYRHLFNPELYLRAYGKIYRNDGSLTPGADTETVDGMSLKKIQAIIEALRYERYRWTPVRRVYIEKKGTHGKRRPLGLPTWSDKLLQEVIRSILEAYYEPQFSDLSHGFRPGRGCHSALAEIDQSWGAVTWFVEGDVSQCFDRLDHGVLHSILAEDIHDNRFLRLIDGLLRAGYLEEWRYHETMSLFHPGRGPPSQGVTAGSPRIQARRHASERRGRSTARSLAARRRRRGAFRRPASSAEHENGPLPARWRFGGRPDRR